MFLDTTKLAIPSTIRWHQTWANNWSVTSYLRKTRDSPFTRCQVNHRIAVMNLNQDINASKLVLRLTIRWIFPTLNVPSWCEEIEHCLIELALHILVLVIELGFKLDFKHQGLTSKIKLMSQP